MYLFVKLVKLVSQDANHWSILWKKGTKNNVEKREYV